MPLIPPETVTQLKKIDLLSYLRQTDPDELMKVGNFYFTRTHDSLCISPDNGLWHWQSRGIGGNNALKYLMKVRGLSFYDALCHLHSSDIQPAFPHVTVKEKKTLALPLAHTNNDIVTKYLVERRGIHPAVVDYCIKNRLIYEGIEKDNNGNEHHNAVFVSYNKAGVAKYGFIRGTGHRRYARDAEGSDKSYSFCLAATGKGNVLKKAEAAIDVLSLATLAYVDSPATWLDYHYLSSGGAANAPLERHLREQPQIDTVDLCNDNDAAGRNKTAREMPILAGRGYKVNDRPPPIIGSGKDYNDYVLLLIQQGRARKRPALLRKMAR